MAVPKKAILVAIPVIGLALGAAGLAWSGLQRRHQAAELTLFGNVDLRQVDLAFNNSERIAAVSAQEGDRVRRGQVLAHLDTERLKPQMEEAAAQAEAQFQVLERLRHGNRPEEIAQARANVASAQADAANARQQYERLQKLFASRAASRQELDSAKAAFDVAQAKLLVSEKALTLAVAGPRSEDVAQAQAQWHADQARLQLLRRQVADSELIAPADAVVRSRLMEPGEITTPQRPVFALAIVDPKWVRAYVSEADLGKIHPGMAATVSADSFPGRHFTGWVGFISPVAEFTPRTVQTTELRTSLVYEIRVFVKDEAYDLRLGMPASVTVSVAPPQRMAQNDSRPYRP